MRAWRHDEGDADKLRPSCARKSPDWLSGQPELMNWTEPGDRSTAPDLDNEVFQIRVCEGTLHVYGPEHILAGQPKCVQLTRPYLEELASVIMIAESS